jgi:hypothetical protein
LFSKGEKWFDKLFNVKYLPLFHHFKAIYQFPKHIIFLVKIVAKHFTTIFLQFLWKRIKNGIITGKYYIEKLQVVNTFSLWFDKVNIFLMHVLKYKNT